jgi:hypothetical protein
MIAPVLSYAPGMLSAVAAALFLGAVMTAGDFVWAYFGVRHSMWAGVAHGALMCLCIGGVVGVRARRPVPGLIAGPLVGVLAAAAFYAIAPTLGWGAMLPAWMLFWICFALLQRFLLTETLRRALARGAVAAVLSGLAFYAISGIWTRPAPGGPNYVIHFLSWTFAFVPGFVTLFSGRADRPRSL